MSNTTNLSYLGSTMDKCILAANSAGEEAEKFNLPLKIGGIFIVLAISTFACMSPLFGTRFPCIKLPKRIMFAARHFGTGVLIATSFCHLLPTAFIALHDECLPQFWLTIYPAMPGAIAMGAIFFVITVEMILCRDIQASEANIDEENVDVAISALAATNKAVLQCTLLEMGILFHSVFIGMSLSVIADDEFVVLLIAIVFHQTFEGLALGARIASINFPQHQRMKPWLMCLAYGATTPIGQALGLLTRSFYNQSSTTGNLVVGVMNSISAGLLIYASLVELFAEDFLSERAEKKLFGRRRWIAFMWVGLGGFAMAFVGAWA